MSRKERMHMDREKTSGVLRIVAGGYLVYTAYNLFQSVRTGQPGNYTLMIACSVLFLILGGVILYMGIKGMKQQGRFGEGEDSESEEMIEDGENAEESGNTEKLIAAEDSEVMEDSASEEEVEVAEKPADTEK